MVILGETQEPPCGTNVVLTSVWDSGRYKVANCTQAQPVFYGFAGLPDGKVILVSVLSGVSQK